MRYYPTFLDLHGRRCLVVGAGEVGRRKLASLLAAAPAEVLVLDLFPLSEIADPELNLLMEHPAVVYEQRSFTASDVQGCALVFACTGNRAVNSAVAKACADNNVLCNVIDAPEEGNFVVPAHFANGDLLVALGTGGNSPALARRIRMELQTCLGDRFAGILTLMGRLRPMVLALGKETRHNSTLFRNLAESGLTQALQEKNRAEAERILKELLPAELHTNIGALLHELA